MYKVLQKWVTKASICKPTVLIFSAVYLQMYVIIVVKSEEENELLYLGHIIKCGIGIHVCFLRVEGFNVGREYLTHNADLNPNKMLFMYLLLYNVQPCYADDKCLRL